MSPEAQGPTLDPADRSFLPQGLCQCCSLCLQSLFPLCLVKSPSAFRAHLTPHFLWEAFLDTQPSPTGPGQNGSHPCHSLHSSTGPSFVTHTCYVSLCVYLCGCLVKDGSSLLTSESPDLAHSLAHSRYSVNTH